MTNVADKTLAPRPNSGSLWPVFEGGKQQPGIMRGNFTTADGENIRQEATLTESGEWDWQIMAPPVGKGKKWKVVGKGKYRKSGRKVDLNDPHSPPAAYGFLHIGDEQIQMSLFLGNHDLRGQYVQTVPTTLQAGVVEL